MTTTNSPEAQPQGAPENDVRYQDNLLDRALVDLDTVLRCEGGMCTHCIDVLCENVVPMLRRLQELRADLPRATGETTVEAWQPIETAPKGRKLIVGYWNPLGNWRSVMGCYYLDGTLESETDESGFAPEGWYEETEAYEYLMPMDHEPTHWQLPPIAPVRAAAQTKAESGEK